ncbi:DUF1565 domain-containing protein [Halolactibacillus sp. JCM 19043]|uniref:DUF1565 domain-containing protein n=1 Tax=Halolactibacillus sp. JCM 19043 TaxID=1460638 RepID=UPI000782FCA8|nr:DUF1565 domain-containing protein [Halolactibacillus sp. JCM 19043]
MEYHVSIKGNDQTLGNADQPFRTISRAAALAVAGDTVIVHKGIYREWVNPLNGGTKDHRIVYKSAGDGEVVITGAERITDWTSIGDNVWVTEVPNAIFSVRHPYDVELGGDWLFDGELNVHLGDVYLDHKSLYETDSLLKVRRPEVWPDARYTEGSLLKWYAEVGPSTTKIWRISVIKIRELKMLKLTSDPTASGQNNQAVITLPSVALRFVKLHHNGSAY